MTQSGRITGITRRNLLQISAATAGGVAAGLAYQLPVFAAGQILVNNGVAATVVVRPDSTPSGVTLGINDLVATVKAATGATLPSVTVSGLAGSGSTYNGYIRLYIGLIAADADPTLAASVAALHDDGFVVAPYGNTLTIVGKSQYGTLLGCYEFLRRHTSARWLIPGPKGEDIPTNPTLVGPDAAYQLDPRFYSRYPYLGSVATANWTTYAYTWSRRNGCYPASTNYMNFTHNLANIFKPSIYNDPTGHPETYHPEFYPPSHVPTSDSDKTGWQPSLTDPNTVQVAADWATATFDAAPFPMSISLGVNDNGGFCEQVSTHPSFPNAVNSFGFLNMSEIYYTWVNAVVDEVLTARPDLANRTFGLLAYNHVADPPSFSLRPQVVPFITKDRNTWVDTTVRSVDQARHTAWLTKASHSGWWDYQYGSPYCLPKVNFHHAKTVAQFGADNTGSTSGIGGIPYFGEVVHNVGEGPKTPLGIRLMMDPTTDVDAYLSDWYTRMVGSAAAPYLANYFSHWEDFWTNRVKTTDWFRSGRWANYLNFTDPGYLNAVSDMDITQSRTWLEAAYTNAVTPIQKDRANVLLESFRFYEASALSYPRMVSTATTAVTANALLDNVEATLQRGLDTAAARDTIYQGYLASAELAFMDPFWQHLLRWSGWNFRPMWNVAQYIKTSEPSGGPVRTRVTTLAGGSVANLATYAQMILDVADGNLVARGTNSSFASGTTGWGVPSTATPPYGSVSVTTEQAHSGTSSLLVNGAFQNLVISQTITVTAGFLRCSLWYYVPAGTTPRGRIFIRPVLRDSNGVIRYYRYEAAPLDAAPGAWRQLDWMEMIPAGMMSAGSLYVTLDVPQTSTKVYLDDIEVQQIV